MTPDSISIASDGGWAALVAAIFAGINGVLMLLFHLRTKARQDATDQELRLARGRAEIAAQHAANASQYALKTIQKVEEGQRETIAKVEESKQQRTVQIANVEAGLKTLEAKVEQGHQETLAVVQENNIISNNYNSKIADAVEGTRQLREDFQNGTPKNTP